MIGLQVAASYQRPMAVHALVWQAVNDNAVGHIRRDPRCGLVRVATKTGARNLKIAFNFRTVAIHRPCLDSNLTILSTLTILA